MDNIETLSATNKEEISANKRVNFWGILLPIILILPPLLSVMWDSFPYAYSEGWSEKGIVGRILEFNIFYTDFIFILISVLIFGSLGYLFARCIKFRWIKVLNKILRIIIILLSLVTLTLFIWAKITYKGGFDFRFLYPVGALILTGLISIPYIVAFYSTKFISGIHGSVFTRSMYVVSAILVGMFLFAVFSIYSYRVEERVVAIQIEDAKTKNMTIDTATSFCDSIKTDYLKSRCYAKLIASIAFKGYCSEEIFSYQNYDVAKCGIEGYLIGQTQYCNILDKENMGSRACWSDLLSKGEEYGGLPEDYGLINACADISKHSTELGQRCIGVVFDNSYPQNYVFFPFRIFKSNYREDALQECKDLSLISGVEGLIPVCEDKAFGLQPKP